MDFGHLRGALYLDEISDDDDDDALGSSRDDMVH